MKLFLWIYTHIFYCKSNRSTFLKCLSECSKPDRYAAIMKVLRFPNVDNPSIFNQLSKALEAKHLLNTEHFKSQKLLDKTMQCVM